MPKEQRPQGALQCMPIIMINMGGEMTYILAQRLSAQKVAPSKSERVLEEVTRALFHADFVAELFSPQRCYNGASTRAIFEKLAHSSIMKLSKPSMDKLYDLMLMAFKYQVVSCAGPDQLYAVTVRHIKRILALVGSSTSSASTGVSPNPAEAAATHALHELQRVHGELPLGEWQLLRGEVLSFLQESRVKLSVLLSAGVQSPNGTLAKPTTGRLPRGAEPPGTVRTFSETGAILTERSVRCRTSAGKPLIEAVLSPRSSDWSRGSNHASSNASSSSEAQFGGKGSGGASKDGRAAAASFLVPGAPAWLHRPFSGYSDPGNPVALGENLYATDVDIKALLTLSAAAKTKGAPSGPLSGPGSISASSGAKPGDNRYGGPRVVDVNNSSGGHGPTHDRTAEAKNGTGVALEPSSSGADQAARSAARAAEDKAHAAAELSVLSSLLSNNSGGGASASDDYRPNVFTLDLFDGDDDDDFGLSIEDNRDASSSSSTQLREVAEAKVDNTVRVDGAAGRKQALSKMVADLGFDDDVEDGDAASKASSSAKGVDCDDGGMRGARGGVEDDHRGSSRNHRPPSGVAQAKDDDFGGVGGDDEDDLLDLMDQASCK